MKMRRADRERFEAAGPASYGISYMGHTHLREEEYEALVRERAAQIRAEREAQAAAAVAAER